MKKIALLIIQFSVAINLYGVERDSLKQNQMVYSLNYWVDIPLTSVALATVLCKTHSYKIGRQI